MLKVCDANRGEFMFMNSEGAGGSPASGLAARYAAHCTLHAVLVMVGLTREM